MEACRSSDIFIRQSWRADFCGIYATAMMLSLLGERTDRARALSIFCLPRFNSAYEGTLLWQITGVLRKTRRFNTTRWRHFRRFSFANVYRELRSLAELHTLPTLLWFGAVHRYRPIRTNHIAVVMNLEHGRINLLDPLGPPPKPSEKSNVSLFSIRQGDGSYRVAGCAYLVDAGKGSAILRWRRA